MYEKLIWKHLFGFGVHQQHPAAEAGIRKFGYHENGNIRTILGVIGFLVIIEGVAIDFFVATKSTKLAMVLGVFHLLMLLYTVALIRASRQRPVLLTPDGLLVRTSLIYSCWVPMDSVHTVHVLEKEVERINSPDVLWCALGDQPNVRVRLSKGVPAILPFGLGRSPSEIYLYLDKPLEFVEAIETLM